MRHTKQQNARDSSGGRGIHEHSEEELNGSVFHQLFITVIIKYEDLLYSDTHRIGN